MKTFKTYLPIFTGFYNTIFEANNEGNEIDEINRLRSEKNLPEIDYDDCEFDYKKHEKNTVFYCIDYVEKTLKDLGFECSIKNEGLQSPKFYNYSNDSINIDIKISLEKIKEYLINNIDEFKEYIKDKYTSRSGFYSSYSNNALEWLNSEIEHNPEHCIGSCLNFIINNEIDEAQMDMYYHIEDNYVWCSNFNELTEV